MRLPYDTSSQREMILRELVLRLIQAGKHTRALDELDLYLPLFPFHDNPVMHVYAGLLALYVAQPPPSMSNDTAQGVQPFHLHFIHTDVPYRSRRRPGPQWNANLLSAARAHFERTKWIDPDNVVATGFLERVRRTCAQGTVIYHTISPWTVAHHHTNHTDAATN